MRGARRPCRTVRLLFRALHALQPVRNTTTIMSLKTHGTGFWDGISNLPVRNRALPCLAALDFYLHSWYKCDVVLLRMQNGIADENGPGIAGSRQWLTQKESNFPVQYLTIVAFKLLGVGTLNSRERVPIFTTALCIFVLFAFIFRHCIGDCLVQGCLLAASCLCSLD